VRSFVKINGGFEFLGAFFVVIYIWILANTFNQRDNGNELAQSANRGTTYNQLLSCGEHFPSNLSDYSLSDRYTG